jgi:hypothetical protein
MKKLLHVIETAKKQGHREEAGVVEEDWHP